MPVSALTPVTDLPRFRKKKSLGTTRKAPPRWRAGTAVSRRCAGWFLKVPGDEGIDRAVQGVSLRLDLLEIPIPPADRQQLGNGLVVEAISDDPSWVAHRNGIGRNVPRNDRMRAYDGAIPDRDPRHYGSVASDPDIIANTDTPSVTEAGIRHRLTKNDEVDRKRSGAVVNMAAFAIELNTACD